MTQALKETSTKTTENLRGLEEDTKYTESLRKSRLPIGFREDFM